MNELCKQIGLTYRVRDLRNNIFSIVPMIVLGKPDALTGYPKGGWFYRVNRT